MTYRMSAHSCHWHWYPVVSFTGKAAVTYWSPLHWECSGDADCGDECQTDRGIPATVNNLHNNERVRMKVAKGFGMRTTFHTCLLLKFIYTTS